MTVRFRPGQNIALKVPSHEFAATVALYRDVLGFEEITPSVGAGDSAVFDFGGKRLWVDSVPTSSQAEIWLEVVADDLDAAARALEAAGCVRRDEIEPLPPGFRGFWISAPGNVIHLVAEDDS